MIVVTGATGHLGRGVVASLVRRMPARQVVATVRDPARAVDLAAMGVEVRSGDFADAGALETAFAGAEQVLIVSADKLGDEAVRLHDAAIDAARRAGARRILYTSHMGARLGSSFPPGDQHARTEASLAASGVAYTALRHGFYAESCRLLLGDSLQTGELQTPDVGAISWTARADLAEADAALLADDGGWQGATPPLAAPEALTMAEVAEVASQACGRVVRHATVTDRAWRDARIEAGTPALYADMLLGMFQAARRGDFAASDPTLERLLGRRPTPLGSVLSA